MSFFDDRPQPTDEEVRLRATEAHASVKLKISDIRKAFVGLPDEQYVNKLLDSFEPWLDFVLDTADTLIAPVVNTAAKSFNRGALDTIDSLYTLAEMTSQEIRERAIAKWTET